MAVDRGVVNGGYNTMEYKELLNRLVIFFSKWNQKYTSTGQINRLRIEIAGQRIKYVFNGQPLCQIEIENKQLLQHEYGNNLAAAERGLLVSILQTTSDLATSNQLKEVTDLAERREIIVLLLRIYHDLEEEVSCSFPEVRELFNHRYFQQSATDEKRQAKLLATIELFRTDLLRTIRGDEIPIRRIERRILYIDSMSVAELCIFFNAATLITDSTDRFANVEAAGWLVRKVCL